MGESAITDALVSPFAPDAGCRWAPHIMHASGSHSRSMAKQGHESVSQRDGEVQEHDMRLLQNSDPSVGAQPSAGMDTDAEVPASNTTGTRDAQRVRAHPHCFSHDTSLCTHRQLCRVHAPRWPHGTKGADFLTIAFWLPFVRESSGGGERGASRWGGRGVVGCTGQALGQPQSTRYSATRRHVQEGTKRAMRHVSNRPTIRTAA